MPGDVHPGDVDGEVQGERCCWAGEEGSAGRWCCTPCWLGPGLGLDALVALLGEHLSVSKAMVHCTAMHWDALGSTGALPRAPQAHMFTLTPRDSE